MDLFLALFNDKINYTLNNFTLVARYKHQFYFVLY